MDRRSRRVLAPAFCAEAVRKEQYRLTGRNRRLILPSLSLSPARARCVGIVGNRRSGLMMRCPSPPSHQSRGDSDKNRTLRLVYLGNQTCMSNQATLFHRRNCRKDSRTSTSVLLLPALHGIEDLPHVEIPPKRTDLPPSLLFQQRGHTQNEMIPFVRGNAQAYHQKNSRESL